ncbi:peptidoglycan-N-acetylmuramic acid deacetylase [Halobacillus karajensis]|uniref:Polysaccharide deacetylase PdaA n=1 Tax=Halobacillus karajensis TaxID=195088 RepID=A0A024P6W1_9BACI|nr:delta-lactam-biosynthetic de-N-acetylase [Halobacillus karajensis]CDQ20454.1 putative polysaccharide deacetylase PdaA precursor [Halobacillus karajensis]CDQ24077.1 putative polysaccharide deacetylase PdaA precursor [Halobacillus karajensis]CDQ27555.1 putative polysaccharide deacetylase PdaA precursor [Halobacillus karajensis]SEH91437.1 peptidoglycan-N-acetylmuramic acid deacetylase [Halobacillus karajensis]
MWKKAFALLLAMTILISPMHTFAEGWGFSKKKDGSIPDVGRYGPMIDKYDGFYVDPSGDPVVYLTFDNGYEQGYTGKVLDVLKEKGVPATFFVTGHYIESAPELLKRMAEEGHLIGNHSWSHPDFTKVSKKKMKKELDRVHNAVRDLTDQDVMTFVRPPRGTFNEQTLQWAREFGYTHAFWSLAFVDWETDKQRGWEYAYENVIKQIHPGAVILLHTVSEDNAEALSQLIDELRKRGYRFGNLNDLMIKQLLPAPIWGL